MSAKTPEDDNDETGPPTWGRWITLAALLVAAVALVWAIRSVGVHTLVARLVRLGPWLVAVLGLELLITACDGAAIYSFLRPTHGRLRYHHAVLAQIAGRAVNVVTPLGSLGEVVKVTMLLERVSQARSIAAILLYNVVNLEISVVMIAVGAPITALLVPMPAALATTLLVAGAVAALIAVLLPLLVRRGMLASIVDLVRRLRLIGKSRARRWRKSLVSVDARLRDGGVERHRARYLGMAFIGTGRVLGWISTFLLVVAAGGPVDVGFHAAVLTAGQVISWAASTVPLGLGLSEGGNYHLFEALGAAPAMGVTVAIGKRVTQLFYAGLGLVLASVSETVKDVRAQHARRRG